LDNFLALALWIAARGDYDRVGIYPLLGLIHLSFSMCFSFLSQVITRRGLGILEDEEAQAFPPSGQEASSVCTIWLVQGEKTTGLVRRWFA
jgi:hypothetical protein